MPRPIIKAVSGQETHSKYPRVLGLLCRIDKSISRLPLFRTIGDHMLIRFERVED